MKHYYQDSAVTLYCGDCREILPSLGRFDLLLTDPPYGVGLKYEGYEDTEANWFELMTDMMPKMIAASEMAILPCCQIARLWWFYKHFPPLWLIAWYKGSPGHRSNIGFNDWEPLVVYGRRSKVWMHDHITEPNDEKMGSYGHPCPKPLRLMTRLIYSTTAIGESVCDPFAGSGTTGRAAKDLSRSAVLIEREERYCEIAARRMEQEVLPIFEAPKPVQEEAKLL